MAEIHVMTVFKYNMVCDILWQNSEVEKELKDKSIHGTVGDATITNFLTLSVAKLEDFIHARKFDGPTFQKSKLAGPDGKLNKTRYKQQTAESIKSDCNDATPCLVWVAWSLWAHDLVLKDRPMPELIRSLPTLEYTVVHSGPKMSKLPSEYLSNIKWVDI